MCLQSIIFKGWQSLQSWKIKQRLIKRRGWEWSLQVSYPLSSPRDFPPTVHCLQILDSIALHFQPWFPIYLRASLFIHGTIILVDTFLTIHLKVPWLLQFWLLFSFPPSQSFTHVVTTPGLCSHQQLCYIKNLYFSIPFTDHPVLFFHFTSNCICQCNMEPLHN